VSLPWGAHRAFGWNGGRVILDPATKLFERRVVWDDTLVVGLAGGGELRVRGEDPLARRVGSMLAAPGPLPGRLAAAGVRYVLASVADRENENMFRRQFADARLVFGGPRLLLFRI
jgi:hypothetical protein